MLIHKLQKKEDLSPSEQALADYVLLHMQQVCCMNTREVAAEAFVSPATVVRFTQKMGFAGFEQFKQKLYAEWSSNSGKLHSVDVDFPFEADTPYIEVLDRMAELEASALQQTKELIATAQLPRIIDDVMQCRTINIYGEGISFSSAANFARNMNQIGYEVFFESDRSRQMRRCAGLNKQHFNLIISYSGESDFTIRVAKLLQQNKRISLSITNERENRLMHCTTYHLMVARMEEQIATGGISNMCSSIAIMFVLDMIYAGVFQRHYEENKQLVHEMGELQHIWF